MIKHFFLLLLFSVLSFNGLLAQDLEMGVNLNSAHYVGDLREQYSEFDSFGDYVSYSSSLTNFSAGFYVRKEIDKRFAFKSNLQWVRLSADDALNQDIEFKERNLSFRNNLFELSGLMEFNFIEFGYIRKKVISHFTPYISAGLSIFSHNPQAFYNGDWVNLMPLSTEGQGLAEYPEREPYKLVQIGIPMGVGFKFAPSPKIRASFAITYNKLFFDHLDDVGNTFADINILKANKGEVSAALADRSKTAYPRDGSYRRGNKEDNDGYWLIGVNFGFIIN